MHYITFYVIDIHNIRFLEPFTSLYDHWNLAVFWFGTGSISWNLVLTQHQKVNLGQDGDNGGRNACFFAAEVLFLLQQDLSKHAMLRKWRVETQWLVTLTGRYWGNYRTGIPPPHLPTSAKSQPDKQKHKSSISSEANTLVAFILMWFFRCHLPLCIVVFLS